jgi:large subunit ribosomal protein L17
MSRHMMRGRQLSRDTEHRKALRRNMAQSLFEHGKIRTTVAKAKEIRPFVEKLITLARRNDLTARRRVIQLMQDRRVTDEEQEFITNEKGRELTVVMRLFNEVAPKFGDRQGGYTRIIKLPEYRIGDAADLVLLQLCTEESAPKGTARRSAGLRRKRNERRHQFASKAIKGGGASAGAKTKPEADAGDAGESATATATEEKPQE